MPLAANPPAPPLPLLLRLQEALKHDTLAKILRDDSASREILQVRGGQGRAGQGRLERAPSEGTGPAGVQHSALCGGRARFARVAAAAPLAAFQLLAPSPSVRPPLPTTHRPRPRA